MTAWNKSKRGKHTYCMLLSTPNLWKCHMAASAFSPPQSESDDESDDEAEPLAALTGAAAVRAADGG